MNSRSVFIVSDRSGVTAETICHTLLSQFPGIDFTQSFLPFVDSVEKVNTVIDTINRAAKETGLRPLVFITFAEDRYAEMLRNSDAEVFDLFNSFINRMEAALGQVSSHQPGQAHGISDFLQYNRRINAVNYAMHCDDGLHMTNYDRASIILLGVSRSGKTPTCLYLALHFGFYAANYPLTEDDAVKGLLPESILAHKDKVFGLTISPERLHQIRTERRPNSEYASLAQCRSDVNMARNLYDRYRIPHCDSTYYSVEELGSSIKHQMGLGSEFH